MESNQDSTIIYWGIIPQKEVVILITKQLETKGIANVKLDKNFPTSINIEGFLREMIKISNSIINKHELNFNELPFEAIFKTIKDTNDEFIGNQILNGKLVITKGGQGMIKRTLLDKDYFKALSDDNNWRKEVQKLKGRKVELKGDIYIHYCAPEEQCPDESYIKYMKGIEYLKIIET